jgi:hypothetical protein
VYLAKALKRSRIDKEPLLPIELDEIVNRITKLMDPFQSFDHWFIAS